MGGILIVQCSGRLIEDEQLHVLGQCLGDFDELLLADADVHNLGIRVFGKSHTIEQLLRLGAGLVPVDHATLGLLVADEDVLRNGQERAQRQFLMNDYDAVGLGIINSMVFAFLAIKGDFAGIATVWVHTRKHVHQGRFACTVLAADGVDLAAIDGKIHIGEGFDRTERLRDVFHRQDGVI